MQILVNSISHRHTWAVFVLKKFLVWYMRSFSEHHHWKDVTVSVTSKSPKKYAFKKCYLYPSLCKAPISSNLLVLFLCIVSIICFFLFRMLGYQTVCIFQWIYVKGSYWFLLVNKSIELILLLAPRRDTICLRMLQVKELGLVWSSLLPWKTVSSDLLEVYRIFMASFYTMQSRWF